MNKQNKEQQPEASMSIVIIMFILGLALFFEEQGHVVMLLMPDWYQDWGGMVNLWSFVLYFVFSWFYESDPSTLVAPIIGVLAFAGAPSVTFSMFEYMGAIDNSSFRDVLRYFAYMAMALPFVFIFIS